MQQVKAASDEQIAKLNHTIKELNAKILMLEQANKIAKQKSK